MRRKFEEDHIVPSSKHIANATRPAAKLMLLALLAPAALLVAPLAHSFNSGDIVVERAKGDARLTQGGRERELRRGLVIVVPATVRTGHDGVVDLRQGATMVNIGPNTVLDFPASQERGVPVERIVQSSGNAFYDVGKRDSRKLRVETPYLVAVIKGTQFSVSVQDNSTSISLVEGSLEILSPDGGASVDLQAGEMASRSRGDGMITVVEFAAPRATTPGPTTGGLAASVGTDVRTGPAASIATTAGTMETSAPDSTSLGLVAGAGADTGIGGAAVDAEVSAGVGTAGVAADAAATIDVGSTGMTVDLGASVDAGSTEVAVDAAIDAGVGPVGAAVSLDTGLDLAAGDAGLAAGTDAGLVAGPVELQLDASADLGVDQSGAGVDIGAGAAVDAGLVGVDMDTTLTADLGGDSGLPATEVDAGVDVVGVTTEVTAGVDLGSGSIDLGLGVGDLDVDLGLDLGLDQDTTEVIATGGTDTGTQGGVVEEAGGILGGLLRFPRTP
jgi:hypothetical protein